MLVSKVHIRGAMNVPLAKAMDKFLARATATTTHQIGTGKAGQQRLPSLWKETVADHDSLNHLNWGVKTVRPARLRRSYPLIHPETIPRLTDIRNESP
jgi:hypothetical protein